MPRARIRPPCALMTSAAGPAYLASAGGSETERYETTQYPLLMTSLQSHPIADANGTGSGHRRVHARRVPVETHDRLLDARVPLRRLRIEVDHHAPLVAGRHGDGGSAVALAERQHAADPLVLEKGRAPLGLEHDVAAEPPPIEIEAGLAA